MTRPAARRPRPAVALLVVVVLVVLGAIAVAVGVAHLRNPAPRSLPRPFEVTPTAATPTAGSPTAGSPTAAGATPSTAGSAASAGSPSAPSPVAVGVPGLRAADGNGIPLTLSVARLQIQARVIPVGNDRDEVVVPTDPASVGWWTGGSVPGALTGTTVIVGHVDSARSGPGALFHLDRLRPADLVRVATTGGRHQDYRVTALRTVPKSRGLDPQTFAADGAPRLVLVTCGGPFDARTRNYADNIVAYASPVRSA